MSSGFAPLRLANFRGCAQPCFEAKPSKSHVQRSLAVRLGLTNFARCSVLSVETAATNCDWLCVTRKDVPMCEESQGDSYDED